MAASRTIYYDSEGNRKVFIGDPRKAPKSATRKKKAVRRQDKKPPLKKKEDLDLLKQQRRKEFLLKPSIQDKKPPLKKREDLDLLKQQRRKKFLPRPSKPIRVEGISPEPSKIKNTYGPDKTSQKGVSKLALKGGGRAYGRNS